MKFFRAILSYSTLIIVIALFAFVLYFRADILPQNINQPVDNAFAQLSDMTGFDIKFAAPPRQQDESTITIVQPPILTSEPSAASVPQVAMPQPEDTSGDDNRAVNTNTVSPADDVAEAEATTEAVVSPSASVNSEEAISEAGVMLTGEVDDMAATEPAIQQQQQVVETDQAERVEAAPAEDKPGADSTQLLAQARQAFWYGDMASSEQYYLELSNIENQDADVFGELGNVYYAQGKWKQAGEAFYQAALRLHESGQTSQLHYLQRVINGLDAEQGKKLSQQLAQ